MLTTVNRPLAVDDLSHIVTLSDPQISPGGERVAFVVKSMDVDRNKYFSHIHVVNVDGEAQPRQLTRGYEASEGQPRWSPDGRFLAFTSGRDNKRAQVFVLPVADGGEAERVTDLPAGEIGDVLVWSPDGSRIAFTFRASDETFGAEATAEREKSNRSTPPREITRLHFREEGKGFLPHARFRLHVLDLTTRQVTLLPTPGSQASDEDTRDAGPFCWSPDGTRLAVVVNTAPDPDLTPGARDLFIVWASGEDRAAVRLNCPSGPKSAPAWSPDGRYVAYLGHDRPDEIWGVTNVHPWAVPANTDGSARDLAPAGWDLTCGNITIGDTLGNGEGGPHWSDDSLSVVALVSDRGSVDVFRFARDGAAFPERLTRGEHAITGLTLGNSEGESAAALLLGTPGDAGDIYLLALAKSAAGGAAAPRRLTRLNEAVLNEARPLVPRTFEAPTPAGHVVPCWALLPPDRDDTPPPDGPRPTIVYVHGGPHLMHAHTLNGEYQTLASAGYVVLYPNPRGSKGYGESWTGAIRGNWGPPAHDDVLACLDYAVAQGWTDPARVGLAGGSYGGYLTAWMIGHTDRFACAVAERGVYNLHSMAGTCDFVWRDDRAYFNANATGDPAGYLSNSPLTYVDAITIPLLLIHSEGDLRCPIEQAEQFFAALRRQNKPVTFLRYGPEANHELSRGGPPDLRLDRLRRIQAFFDRHLKKQVVGTENPAGRLFASEENKQ